MQVGAALRAGVEHRTPIPEHLPHGDLVHGDGLLRQLLLEHLRLLQHGLQVPRDDENALLQTEGRRQVGQYGHITDSQQTTTVGVVVTQLDVNAHTTPLKSLGVGSASHHHCHTHTIATIHNRVQG